MQSPSFSATVPDPQRELAVRLLRAYWQTHPNAADTVEGIYTWWLHGGTDHAPDLSAVMRALTHMAAQQEVMAVNVDQRLVWRLRAALDPGPNP